MKELTKEDIINGSKDFYLTVGELKDFLSKSNLSDDSKVLCQRVTDYYFEERGWGVYTKDNDYLGPSQYIPAFSCLTYKNDENILFIDLHY